jgi:mannose/fructose/N-acetylgalactosamine-specific phosphotransferase system component IID
MPLDTPQFFDIFGIIGFVYIIVFSIWVLKTKKPVSVWALAVLFAIGIIGFLVDSAIVYFSYLK